MPVVPVVMSAAVAVAVAVVLVVVVVVPFLRMNTVLRGVVVGF